MPPRIGPRKPVRVFLAEWREYIGVSQQDLGNRFDPPVAKGTISRWESKPSTVSLGVVSAYAEALGPKVRVIDLYRLPPA
jgi:transcriptional regulator with XRE-family HTH domain